MDIILTEDVESLGEVWIDLVEVRVPRHHRQNLAAGIQPALLGVAELGQRVAPLLN